MKANSIAFGVIGEGDEAVLTYGEFFSDNTAAIFDNAGSFNCAVIATEIDQSATAARGVACHFEGLCRFVWNGQWCCGFEGVVMSRADAVRAQPNP